MTGATVVVVGSGGREHALCLSLNASPKVGSLHCVPGNAGTARIATNHASESSIEALVSLFKELAPDLVVVGPEAPLCDGLADACAEADIACFGPVAALAHLEGSKLHAKQAMEAAGVPTAAFHRLDKTSNIDGCVGRVCWPALGGQA